MGSDRKLTNFYGCCLCDKSAQTIPYDRRIAHGCGGSMESAISPTYPPVLCQEHYIETLASLREWIAGTTFLAPTTWIFFFLTAHQLARTFVMGISEKDAGILCRPMHIEAAATFLVPTSTQIEDRNLLHWFKNIQYHSHSDILNLQTSGMKSINVLLCACLYGEAKEEWNGRTQLDLSLPTGFSKPWPFCDLIEKTEQWSTQNSCGREEAVDQGDLQVRQKIPGNLMLQN